MFVFQQDSSAAKVAFYSIILIRQWKFEECKLPDYQCVVMRFHNKPTSIPITKLKSVWFLFIRIECVIFSEGEDAFAFIEFS